MTMGYADIELATYRLEKARSQIQSAEILFAHGKYEDSVCHSFQAVLAAARALLALKQLDGKKSGGVVSLFNRYFLKTGVVTVEAGRDLARALVKRKSLSRSEYYTVSKVEAQSQLQTAQKFLASLEREGGWQYLNNALKAQANAADEVSESILFKPHPSIVIATGPYDFLDEPYG